MSDHNLFIGCGNMGSAMVAGWLLAGEDPASFTAVRPGGGQVPGIRTVRSIGEADLVPDRIILGFKPQQLRDLAPEVARWVTKRTTRVSMLAAWPTSPSLLASMITSGAMSFMPLRVNRMTLVRLRKSFALSPLLNRAVPPVGSTWLGPAA